MPSDSMTRYEKQGRVAVITFDNPPVNALAPGMREDMVAGLEKANADTSVDVIIIRGANSNFIAGADIRQFGKARGISSATSAAAIADSAKPVIAVIEGYCLGGGLEHALACHYRIAAPTARLGLPEVKIGLIPGGGGTQRLPRQIGARLALDIILSGRHVRAEEAQEIGLVDTVEEEPLQAALALAKNIAGGPLPVRVQDRAVLDADDSVFAQARKRVARQRHKAPFFAIELVEAAARGLDFNTGMAQEREKFTELENSPEAKALRYAFFAEKAASKIPGAPADYKPPKVRKPAIIGAGTMGGGIAMAFADVGTEVLLLDANQEGLDRGLARIRANYEVKLKRGTITAQEIERRMSLIRPVTDFELLAGCDAVIEAVFERIQLKQEIFSKLDRIMSADALLLTNSSAIDINTIAASTTRPEMVAGSHFFAPANIMKLCEIVRGDKTSMETLLRAAKMGRDLGKISVIAGTCDGFAANRSRAPLVTEMMLLLEEGALPQQIDKVMIDFGYPMGPFAVSDLSGLDVSYDTRKRRAAANPNFRKLHVPDRLVELGRHGQKVGAGWYRYEPGDRTPHPDPAVTEIIRDVSRELNIPQREFSDEEILRRLLFASVNEACKILEEGKALRASDIDVMWLNGFGFPRHRGGLLYWADGIGSKEIYEQVAQWHRTLGDRWTPSELLSRLAADGAALREAEAAVLETQP